jgi:hypothetical protein
VSAEAQRVAVRVSQSRPIYQRLHRALVLFKKSRRYQPRSAFGQAIDYALSNWPLLGVYLEDGRIEIDNNLVENAIRPTAVGKKNWLFLGDADAGCQDQGKQQTTEQQSPLHFALSSERSEGGPEGFAGVEELVI